MDESRDAATINAETVLTLLGLKALEVEIIDPSSASRTDLTIGRISEDLTTYWSKVWAMPITYWTKSGALTRAVSMASGHMEAYNHWIEKGSPELCTTSKL